MSKTKETEENDASSDVPTNVVVDEAQVEEPLSAAEIAELREKAARADENWERALRQTAELENFKKRSAREREDAVRYANERFVGQLLPVLDSFTMAMAATESAENVDVDSLKTGVSMILTQFQGVLRDMGIEELDASGKPFDPAWQEAMSQQETTDAEDGHVLQQLRKGYRLKDRLIRPASVIVAKAPVAQPETPPASQEDATEEGAD
jgi:molecular chaperone GrpE